MYLAVFVCSVVFVVMVVTETKQTSPLVHKELETNHNHNQSFNYDYFDIIKMALAQTFSAK